MPTNAIQPTWPANNAPIKMTDQLLLRKMRTLVPVIILAHLTLCGCYKVKTAQVARESSHDSDWVTTAQAALEADNLSVARDAAENGLEDKEYSKKHGNLSEILAEVDAREAFLNQRVVELTDEGLAYLRAGDQIRAKARISQALKIKKATNLDIARDALSTLRGYEIAQENKATQNDSSTRPWPETISRAQRGILLIGVKFNDGFAQGTGFAVGDNLIVTNSHVISQDETDRLAEAIVVVNGDKQHIQVQGLLYRDLEKDIAVIRTESKWPQSTKLTLLEGHPQFKSPLQPGEEVAALGHPKGFTFSTAIGHVSAIRAAKTMPFEQTRANTNGVWIQHTASISQGNSGGPLINRAGAVVAMNTLIFHQGVSQNLNFAISAADIRDAVQQAQKSDLTEFSGNQTLQSTLKATLEQLQTQE